MQEHKENPAGGRPAGAQGGFKAKTSKPSYSQVRHFAQANRDPWENVLARRISRDAQALTQLNPSLARGLVHSWAEALPDPERPTMWGDGRQTESPASWLHSETIEDIANWGDLASPRELQAAAVVALMRLPKGVCERLWREVSNAR